MDILKTTLLFGLLIGVIHFVIIGILYQNPFVAGLYKSEEDKKAPGLQIWTNKKKYLLSMFLGTQIEVFILTFAYVFFKNLFLFSSLNTAFMLAGIFSAIRIYPRFWNMYIQSTYPAKLLAVEFINGILSTFAIVLGLYFLL